MRQQLKDERERSSATYDFATENERQPFDRFEDLARKIVNVPKKEIDEKRREEG